ncbi:hypothetical protein AC622_00600 [Bacillus sp. FJAT-27916]|uniref:stage II sporulation protein R n=1 Tax=Bacillus sp. FJAT-27916 TaxID=1679169 RepID=UPI00067143F8|nr:hypothetical protein AC622_00600 [Bacillus sp. FJAT-27916]
MMMRGRTYLPLLYILLLSMATMAGLMTPKSTETNAEVQVIPSEAIRLRILANSNHESDQELKRKIRDEVNAEINIWVAELTSIEEARKIISSRLDEIEVIAMEVMEREGNVQKVDVEFGKTVFPTKLYGQYLYPAGEYEAIKITLGEGEGENWWCVLFPPLCFLDFNSGTAVKAQTTEEEAAKQPIDEEVSKEKTVNQSIEQESEKPEAAQAEVINQSIDEEESAEETKVVYEDRDEEQVEVKFFLKEIFDSLF